MPDFYDIPYNISELDDADIFAPAVGDMLIYSAENKWRNVETGDSGQVWTAQGQGEEPGWATINTTEIANAGGRVLVNGSGGITLTPASGQSIVLGGGWYINQYNHLRSDVSASLLTSGGAYVGYVQAGINGIESNPSSGAVGLKINLAASQTASGIEQKDSSGAVNFAVSNVGSVTTTALVTENVLALNGGQALYIPSDGSYIQAGTSIMPFFAAKGGFGRLPSAEVVAIKNYVTTSANLRIELASGQTASGIEQRTFADVVNFRVDNTGAAYASAYCFGAGTLETILASVGGGQIRLTNASYSGINTFLNFGNSVGIGYDSSDGLRVTDGGSGYNAIRAAQFETYDLLGSPTAVIARSGIFYGVGAALAGNLSAAAGAFGTAYPLEVGGNAEGGSFVGNATFGTYIHFATGGRVLFGTTATGASGYDNNISLGRSDFRLSEVHSNNFYGTAGAFSGGITTGNYSYLTAPAAAPLDGNLALGQMAHWHDESNHKIVFRVRRSDGVYENGEVPLSP